MNGLELSKGYYEEYGKPMLEKDFPEIRKYLAIGFVGKGSEHFGFDDDISQDHDFEPGFNIFLPGEDIIDRHVEFQLERAYAKLPKEYRGFKHQPMSPVGGNRNGIMRTEDFYISVIGNNGKNLTDEFWLRVPEYALCEATDGEIFEDEYGEFTAIRENLKQMPEDVRLKRLAGNILLMAQSGQYNYARCIKHGEPEAAQLACLEYIKAAMNSLFLLNNKYMPYYKWSFRALREMEGVERIERKLKDLLYGDNSNAELAEDKYYIIEDIASEMIETLQDRSLTKAICGDLEKHAYSINDMITDSTIRNMNILVAV